MKTQDWIKTRLKVNGRKLKEAAELLNVPAPRITEIIKGNREVQSDEIIPLAGLLGISVTALLRSLEAGELIDARETAQGQIPVSGQLFGDGLIIPNSSGTPYDSVALPPGITTTDGLVCYQLGDDSLDQEIRKGSLIIAADPQKHFFPMIPGSIFLIRTDSGGLAPRLYHQTNEEENWLIPLPKKPDPRFESWQFSLFPAHGKKTVDHKTVHTEDIAFCVIWVQKDYTPAH